ncbi:IS4 family transposase [Sorangium sp. So ce117]|uniref:IS4 family transposase n=1 Tax=Sorangium sp. So ce117 TaxID=3133277 RepID=UPI003F646105
MGNPDVPETTPSIVREFETVQLGDARLHQRVRAVVARLSVAPGESFPDSLKTEAELEGFYRLLGNKRVSYGALVQAHSEQTLERMAGHDTVRAVHDTTAVAFDGDGARKGLGPLNGKDTQGFLAHATLAVATDAINQPLGLLGLACWARKASALSKSPRKKNRTGSDYARVTDKESTRWLRQVEAAEQAVGDRTSLLHVMDREADAYPLLCAMVEQGHRFVVRMARDRNVSELAEDEEESLDDSAPLRLSEALVELPIRLSREVVLTQRRAGPVPASKRAHPARSERSATLGVGARRVALRRPYYLPELAEELAVNVVLVQEIDTPAGEEPVAWVLVTNEPVDTPDQIAAIVDHYRARWLIEEFFKALKTGCALETRQLESFRSLTNAMALFAPIAWQMLLLRSLSRLEPNAPAERALNPTQLKLLHQHQPKKLPAQGATVVDALYAVAGLGGHLKRNGPPGWLTLARGMQTLLMLETGWNAALANTAKTKGEM